VNILHIITDSNIGGAGRLLLAFLREYDRQIFNLEVALPQGSLLAREITALNVAFTELPFIAEKSFSLKGLKEISRLIKAKKPDIVHTHASLAGRIAAKIRGCKIVHSRHYCVDTTDDNATRFPFKQATGFINHFFSDAIIATAPEVKKGLVATGTRPEHISVICNGVPPARELSAEEKLAVREKYGIPPEAFVVSQIARLTEVKGHDYTLEAAKLWADECLASLNNVTHTHTGGFGIAVLLAGDGPLEGHIRQRVENEKLANVRLTGFISDIDEIYNITDVQINSSFTETTCLTLLEGMSLGVPAVATDGGGNPHTLKHGKSGLIVPVGDAAALAGAVLAIKSDAALREKLSRGAIEEYQANFRADKMARSIENLYLKVGTANTNTEKRRP